MEATVPPVRLANSPYFLPPKSTSIPKSYADVPDIVDLTIDSLSFNGGRGVGRTQGLVVFVADTAPLDRVRVRLTRRKKRYAQGEVMEILASSPIRRQPPCPVAARCGGCSWQHVTYAAQLEQKTNILRESLRSLRNYGAWHEMPIIGAQQEFHYRNRIQVQVRNGEVGFFAKRSHQLVPTRECWIAEKPLNERLKTLTAAEINGHSKIELMLTDQGDVVTNATESVVFAQVNRWQNTNLQGCVLDFITITPQWIVDLYAGTGNLTLPLSKHFAQASVTAVELNRNAVQRGRQLSQTNTQAARIQWLVGDAAEVVAQIKPQQSEPGLIVLDPPRSGCSQDLLAQVSRLAPKQIVYVSCNPMTFARDCEVWLKNGLFRLERVQGIDMFPQTEHVELVALLCAAT